MIKFCVRDYEDWLLLVTGTLVEGRTKPAEVEFIELGSAFNISQRMPVLQREPEITLRFVGVEIDRLPPGTAEADAIIDLGKGYGAIILAPGSTVLSENVTYASHGREYELTLVISSWHPSYVEACAAYMQRKMTGGGR